MATTTLAATLNTPLSELRPATMDRILVIADDSGLRKALQRLFSLERYEVEVVTDSVTGLARLRERLFSAVILDLQRQLLVFPRVDVIEAAAQYSHRFPLGFECPPMCRRIDAASQTAADRETAAGQLAR